MLPSRLAYLYPQIYYLPTPYNQEKASGKPVRILLRADYIVEHSVCESSQLF